jgi:hypothetical protein
MFVRAEKCVLMEFSHQGYQCGRRKKKGGQVNFGRAETCLDSLSAEKLSS